jgi:hypothetical protein
MDIYSICFLTNEILTMTMKFHKFTIKIIMFINEVPAPFVKINNMIRIKSIIIIIISTEFIQMQTHNIVANELKISLPIVNDILGLLKLLFTLNIYILFII